MRIKEKVYLTNEKFKTKPFWLRWSILLTVAILFGISIIGLYWSREPSIIDFKADIQIHQKEGTVAAGIASAISLKTVMNALLVKSGGLLSNDKSPPGWFLDNIPAFEEGAIFQIRDFSRALRKDFSRSQALSTEDTDLKNVENRLVVSPESWAFPDAESEYGAAVKSLDKYIARLSSNTAYFYPRADNLNDWLGGVESRLGDLSVTLSQSVGSNTLSEAGELTDRIVKTPWSQLDNVFYNARGQAWALIHLLKGIEIDFNDILVKKNAIVPLRQIIRDLEASQDMIWSPIILNGSGFGLLANHSLTLASYLSRSTVGISKLRQLLSNG